MGEIGEGDDERPHAGNEVSFNENRADCPGKKHSGREGEPVYEQGGKRQEYSAVFADQAADYAGCGKGLHSEKEEKGSRSVRASEALSEGERKNGESRLEIERLYPEVFRDPARLVRQGERPGKEENDNRAAGDEAAEEGRSPAELLFAGPGGSRENSDEEDAPVESGGHEGEIVRPGGGAGERSQGYPVAEAVVFRGGVPGENHAGYEERGERVHAGFLRRAYRHRRNDEKRGEGEGSRAAPSFSQEGAGKGYRPDRRERREPPYYGKRMSEYRGQHLEQDVIERRMAVGGNETKYVSHRVCHRGDRIAFVVPQGVGGNIEEGHADRKKQNGNPERPVPCQVLVGFFIETHNLFS